MSNCYIWCMVVVACTATIAGANEANHQPYIVGDRAAGMGGGIVAMASSADAPYYNPAGLARTKQNQVSLSGVLYGYQEVRTGEVFFNGEDASARTLAVIPTTVSIVHKLGDDAAYAISIFEPTTHAYRLVESYPQTEHFYNLNRESQTLWGGLSYGRRVSKRLMLGASLFGVYKSYTSAENLYWGDLNLAYSQASEYQSGELVAMVGLQATLSDRWSAGITLQSPSVHLFGDGNFYDYSVLAISGLEEDASSQAEGLDAENLIPPRVRAGLSWEDPGRFAWGLDVTWYDGAEYDRLDGTFRDGSPARVSIVLESTIDINTGVEWYLADRYPLRMGAFTSQSAAPATSLESSAAEHINLYGLTCSIGQREEHTGLDIGLMYVFGKGKTQSFSVNEAGDFVNAFSPMRESHLYVTVNSSYQF